MKNARSKKILSMLLTLVCALSAFAPCVASAAGIQPTVLDVVSEYMDVRYVLLSTGDISVFVGFAVTAFVTDELAHRQLLGEEDITLPDVQYVIDSVNAWDNYILVEMREIEEIVFIGEPSFEVSHTILIKMDKNQNPLVISDNYTEGLSGFESCSYVPENYDPDADLNTGGDRSICLLYVANSQVGYKEKESDSQLNSFTANAGNKNYSKYGEWYGSNPAAWCAMFVSWCANQANVSPFVVPCEAYVPNVVDRYQSQGRYYASESQGGSYTPKPGDLFILDDEDHVGIVYSVSSDYITVIDGNWDNQVCKRTINRTDSSLTGYASPLYISAEHNWDNSSGLQHCTNCGATRSNVLG